MPFDRHFTSTFYFLKSCSRIAPAPVLKIPQQYRCLCGLCFYLADKNRKTWHFLGSTWSGNIKAMYVFCEIGIHLHLHMIPQIDNKCEWFRTSDKFVITIILLTSMILDIHAYHGIFIFYILYLTIHEEFGRDNKHKINTWKKRLSDNDDIDC